jgi:mRNA interferase MazF
VIGRGSVVIVSTPGDYGKPRPAVVIQTDAARDIGSYVVCLITSDVLGEPSPFRLPIVPSASNGLRLASEVMISKIVTMPKDKVRGPMGSLTKAEMAAVTQKLTVLLGLLDED